MPTRTTTKTLTFSHPFRLSGADDLQPAGSYVVEIEEERLDTSFPTYRWLTTSIRLPGTPGSMAAGRIIDIDPAELEAALKKDMSASKAPGPKKPSWTWTFESGVLTIHHLGATVSLGRYATREFAAKAAAAYIAKQTEA